MKILAGPDLGKPSLGAQIFSYVAELSYQLSRLGRILIQVR